MGTFTQLTYHIIFGTRFRRRTIRPQIRNDLYAYAGGTIRGMKGHPIEIGGVDDHLRVLTKLPPTIALSDAIRDLKSNTSKWVNDQSTSRDRFEWQKGYAAFTVSFSQIDDVVAYLRNQEEHHRQKSFKDEYIEFLRRHQIPFEENFLFDGEHVG